MSLVNATFVQIFNEFSTETVDASDIFLLYKPSTGQVHGILGSDLFPAADDSSQFQWSSTFSYAIDDPVISGQLWWISTQANNTGNVPGPTSSFWTQINKVTSSGLKKWEPGLYVNTDEYVVDSLILYELNDSTTRPFNSQTAPSADAANWSPVGGGSGNNTEIVDTYPDMINWPNPQDAQIFYVLDATGDPTVDSGGAQYIYRLATDEFIKVAEFESQDIDFSNFTRNDTGENNLLITPANNAFYSSILSGGKATLKAIIDFLTANRNDEEFVDIGNQSGSITIDLSNREIIQLNATGPITLDFSNEKIGRTYTLIVDKNSFSNFNFVAGLIEYVDGRAFVMTDPANNGSSPSFSRDILTLKCLQSGILTTVGTPDLRLNS